MTPTAAPLPATRSDASPAGPPPADTRALVAHAAEIARRGYAEPVVALALNRLGCPPQAARLVAASVVCSRAELVAIDHDDPKDHRGLREHGDHRDHRDPGNAGREIGGLEPGELGIDRQAELRVARAASRALAMLLQFFLFVVVGLGAGAWLGWSIGFTQGIEDGFERVIAVLEQVITH